jgi:hypothetical protein
MINEAKFPQPWIDEYEPKFEESPCITTHISDLPQAEQDRINGLKGSRNSIYKKFKIKNKGVTK